MSRGESSIMKLARLPLGPHLSAVSWFFIETFFLVTIFFLPFSKSVGEGALLVCLALWLLRKFPWDEAFPFVPICNLSYLVFLVAVLLSFTHIPKEDLATGVQGFLKWLKYLGVFFMSVDLFKNEGRTKRFVFVFLVSMTLVCANGFYQLWTGVDLIKHYAVDIPGRFIRMKSSFGSPNGLAAFLAMAIPIGFFVWFKKNRWSPASVLLALMLILFGVSFILTLSRAALLGLFISVGAVVLVSQKKRILIPVLLSPLLLLASKTLRDNFFASLSLKDITIAERFRFWETTLRMIKDHPWLGNGVNTYYLKFAAFAPAEETYRGYAHNCYLQMWGEVGILGLLAFMTPLLVILIKDLFGPRSAKQGLDLKDVLFVGLGAFLVQSFFDTNFYALQASILFWIFWGMYNSASAIKFRH